MSIIYLIKENTLCTFWNETESRYSFAARTGSTEQELIINGESRQSGVFLDASIVKQIKLHSKQNTSTNAKYYPYQKKLLEQSSALADAVNEGCTVFWQRNAPNFRMELLIIKDADIAEVK